MLVHKGIAYLQRFVRNVTQRSAYTNRIVVTQITPNLADDHRHGIGGKTYILAEVEIVDCLHQADAANLKKIIYVFTSIVKPLNHAQNETQVTLDQFVTSCFVFVAHSLQ